MKQYILRADIGLHHALKIHEIAAAKVEGAAIGGISESGLGSREINTNLAISTPAATK